MSGNVCSASLAFRSGGKGWFMHTVRIEEVVGVIAAWLSGDDPAAESALQDMLTDLGAGEGSDVSMHRHDDDCSLKVAWGNRLRFDAPQMYSCCRGCAMVDWLAKAYMCDAGDLASALVVSIDRMSSEGC